MSISQICAVLLSGSTCGIYASSASAATNSFRRDAEFLVTRVGNLVNADRNSTRPSSNAARQSLGIRINSMARAGQIITGCLPRSRMRKIAFSMGEWKPLTTVTPSSRNPRATSWERRMEPPGVFAEQNTAVRLAPRTLTGPMACKASGAASLSLLGNISGHSGWKGSNLVSSSDFIRRPSPSLHPCGTENRS